MKVKFFILFLPAAIGIYLGFIAENLKNFLIHNNLANTALGLLCGGVLVILTFIAAKDLSTEERPKMFDFTMMFFMPLISCLLFSNLFGLIVFGVSSIIHG